MSKYPIFIVNQLSHGPMLVLEDVNISFFLSFSSLLKCVLVVFGELPISSCEISSMAPLFAPICCFRLVDPISTSLVVDDAPKLYNFFLRSANCCIQSSNKNPIEGS